MLLYSNIVYSAEELIQVPCQGGTILIQPNIKQLPDSKYGIHFVRTWAGDYIPYIVISEHTESYEATTVGGNIGNKYAGYILVKNENIDTISFEGCLFNWKGY